jgi:prevent-host-death family protein
MYMSSWTFTEARTRLADVLDAVERGEEATITRHGRAVAVIVRPDKLKARRTERLDRRVDELRRHLLSAPRPTSSSGLSVERAEEMIADLRAERDAS